MILGQYTLSRLRTLQPTLQPLAQTFLERCAEAGIPCEITQGTRTFAEQQRIYDQGRSAPGAVVTQAKPGDSYHQYGLAFDVVPTAYKSLPDWNPGGPFWATIGAIGKSLGLEWGGDWRTPDQPHFQIPSSVAPLAELKAYWEKFKAVMPVSITPTTGGTAIILLLVAVWFVVIQPRLTKAGML